MECIFVQGERTPLSKFTPTLSAPETITNYIPGFQWFLLDSEFPENTRKLGNLGGFGVKYMCTSTFAII